MYGGAGNLLSFATSAGGAALITTSGQVAGAAIVGRSNVRSAEIAASAQAAQLQAQLEAQRLDNEFGKNLISYVPQLALLGAATLVAVVAIKTFSE